MGAKGSKGSKDSKPEQQQKKDFSEKDYKFLTTQTGYTKDEIKNIFNKFNENNPDGLLDKKEFIRLYGELRPEQPELLDEISIYVFRCFDSDHNGSISFNEFLTAYAITSRGDVTKKLEYAFDVYDLDGNGYLDNNELKTVLYGMLDMLGADKKAHNIPALAAQCMEELDTSNDGKVSKSEFVKGLSSNYGMRALMSPF